MRWEWLCLPHRRPKIHREILALIRSMSRENPLWAPRINGEVLMLGLARSTGGRQVDEPS